MSSRIRILFTLAAMMFVAGLAYGVLSGDIATSATAEESSPVEETQDGRDPSACLSDPRVLEEIRAQREILSKTQKELAAKEQELKQREQALAEEIKKVQAIRDEVTKTNELKKKENQEKVAKIIETLGTMSPKASAKMLAELDDVLAVEVLSQMDTAKLAKIMNLLEPKRSSMLTEMLAGVTRAKTAANAQRMGAAAGDSVTGRDVARNSSLKGGEKYDGQNNDNSKNPNDRVARQDSSDRKPSAEGRKGTKTQ